MNSLILVLLVALFTVLKASSDFNAALFNKEVLEDERVWLVEFYSPMCGSCKEFSPTWNKIESSLKSVVMAKINIDTPEGLRVAQDMGALDEGIPNVQLFSGRVKQTLMAGDPLSLKELTNKIKESTSTLTRRDDGFFLKKA